MFSKIARWILILAISSFTLPALSQTLGSIPNTSSDGQRFLYPWDHRFDGVLNEPVDRQSLPRAIQALGGLPCQNETCAIVADVAHTLHDIRQRNIVVASSRPVERTEGFREQRLRKELRLGVFAHRGRNVVYCTILIKLSHGSGLGGRRHQPRIGRPHQRTVF